MRIPPAAREDVLAFAEAVGVRLFDHQRDALAAAVRREAGCFVVPVAGICWPRGDGKTWTAALVGAWRLVCGRAPQEILSAALDLDGARRTTRYGRAFLRSLVRAGEVEERADGFVVPATSSVWDITSREHTASRGRHPTVTLYDEVGWARDAELFESLLSAQASVQDPLMLVTSTVGARRSGPLWDLAKRAQEGDAAVVFLHANENRSPLVTRSYLERMRRLKHPVLFAREHENRWSDGDDAFVAAEWVEAAMSRGWSGADVPDAGCSYNMFVDLGLVHDPTVYAVAHRAEGLVWVDRIVTHQGSRRRPVDLVRLADELRAVADLWHARVVVESWQGVAVAQELVRRGARASVRTPTAKSQGDMWSLLSAQLGAGSIVLPPHERLREELLGLTVELRPGGGLRVVGGAPHQDHAVAVAGAVEMALGRSGGPVEVASAAGRGLDDRAFTAVMPDGFVGMRLRPAQYRPDGSWVPPLPEHLIPRGR